MSRNPSACGLTERSRRLADEVVDGLRSSYDPCYLEFASVDDPALFATGRRLVADGFGWGTGAWVTDDRGRVLMIRHPGDRQWGIPAGAHEPDLENTVEETARREVFEETGVTTTIDDCFRLHHKCFYLPAEPTARLYMVEAFFEGRATDPEIELVPDRWEDHETIAEADWKAQPPSATIDLLSRRVDEHDWSGNN